jgi:hypothetical protein
VPCPCLVIAFIQTSDRSGAGIAGSAGSRPGGGRCEGGGGGGGGREPNPLKPGHLCLLSN